MQMCIFLMQTGVGCRCESDARSDHTAGRTEKKEGRFGSADDKGSNVCWKKTPLSLFSFSSSLNHKMPQRSPLAPLCVWHRSGHDTDSHPQCLLWSSSYQPPPRLFCGGPPRSHFFTESTHQKDASRKWSLECRESRVARRYRWWKAFAKFNLGSERERGREVQLFHFKDISAASRLWCR